MTVYLVHGAIRVTTTEGGIYGRSFFSRVWLVWYRLVTYIYIRHTHVRVRSTFSGFYFIFFILWYNNNYTRELYCICFHEKSRLPAAAVLNGPRGVRVRIRAEAVLY